jgi:hypothetical protein
MFDFLNKYRNTNTSDKDNLVDEKENKALVFIIFLVIIGLLGIVIFVYQDYVCAIINKKISYAYSMLATLFFVAGALFTFSNLIGFLFGIPRTIAIDESEKSKSQYIGNDNLLQVSDWITKIIIGLGLTQINEMPQFLKKVASFIMDNTHVSNRALIILIILYFACLGFLFGYLWTRLYFIKMLHASDNDVNNNDDTEAQIITQIKTDITTAATTGEEKQQ